jgi:hypothetical protein
MLALNDSRNQFWEERIRELTRDYGLSREEALEILKEG